MSGIPPGLIAYKLAFQVTPIVLTGTQGGITQNIPGGMLPIIAITESLNFASGLLGGFSGSASTDDFFATFAPLGGSTIIDQAIGTYPLGSQQVAANAVITQPLRISMLMDISVRKVGGYALKLATMTALQIALNKHNTTGGSYTIMTPSYIYTNCLMTTMRDVSHASGKQAQSLWQLDFTQPLLTVGAVQQSQNALISQITGGLPTGSDPTWSGTAAAVGNPSTIMTAGLAPSASGTAGAQASPTAGL